VGHTGLPRSAPYPSWWQRDALCVQHYEGAWNANTGNGFYGGMQFKLTTWYRVGGRGRPDLAAPSEQLWRAWLLYRVAGWSPWPVTSRLCGL
jgi:hypothetical protein